MYLLMDDMIAINVFLISFLYSSGWCYMLLSHPKESFQMKKNETKKWENV